MKKEIFSGVGTALVTPFSRGKIDWVALERLIEFQITGGVDALIIGGTTGEAATLRDEERYELFRAAKDITSGRVKLVFGTGTNDTRAAIKHTLMAEEIGADGVLLVTPYYNKGTREGLYQHYEEITRAANIPAILYNVPGRTGVNIDIEMVRRLAENEKIVGIKEASGSLSRLLYLSALDIPLYAGNDAEFFTTLTLGGVGVISVISNIYPEKCKELFTKYKAGKIDDARKILIDMLPAIDAMFIETNPAPIKYAMMKMGLCSGEMRLPMYEVSQESAKKLDTVLGL